MVEPGQREGESAFAYWAFRKFIALPYDQRTFDAVADRHRLKVDRVAALAETWRWAERANRHDRLALEAAQTAEQARSLDRICRDIEDRTARLLDRMIEPFQVASDRYRALVGGGEAVEPREILEAVAEMALAVPLAIQAITLGKADDDIDLRDLVEAQAILEREARVALMEQMTSPEAVQAAAHN